jgi:bifunctional isochorismate lyase/aryl carrier protein
MAIPKITPYSLIDAATLPVNKVNWTINPAKAVLLIHDMQNYFVNFYQRDAEPMASLLRNIYALKTACRAAGIPVVYTAQPGDQRPQDRALLTDFWGTGLRADPALTDIAEELALQADDIQYTKWRYSAFKRTPLLDTMQTLGRDQLIICGVYAHIGILATSLEAFMFDIKPIVVADAVADFSLQDHQMALNYIAQRCGYVETLATTLRAVQHVQQRPLSLETLQQDVANILQLPVDEVEADENLMYLGLDSIRVMSLLENWRSRGAQITFMDLAEVTTLNEWWKIIAASMQETAPVEALA